MSERDGRDERDDSGEWDDAGDYLWDGRAPSSSGPPPADVTWLEAVMVGHRLREPVRGWPRFTWWLGPLLALLLLLVPPQVIPVSWVAALVPGASSVTELVGGTEVEVVSQSGAPSADWLRELDRRLGQIHPGSRLVREGSALRAEVTGASAEAAALALRTVSWSPQRFQVHETLLHSPVMERLCAHADRDPRAAELGVYADRTAVADDRSGPAIADCHLAAINAPLLRRYLHESLAANPHLRPEPYRAIVVDGGRIARTHYIDLHAWLDSQHVVTASAGPAPEGGALGIHILLTEEGQQRLRAAVWAGGPPGASARALAFIADGEVFTAAPVERLIQTPALLLVLADDKGIREPVVRAMRALHREPVQQPEPGALSHSAGREPARFDTPIPLVLDASAATSVPPALSRSAIDTIRWLLVFAIGLALCAPLALLDGRTPRLDPEVSPVRGRRLRKRFTWLRLGVTAMAAAIGFAVRELPVPAAATGPNLFLVGLTAIAAAFLLVELAAAALPSLRRLRGAEPQSRRAAIATAILAVAVAPGALWIEGWPAGDGAGLLAIVTASLGVAMLIVDRFGLGSGFAAVLLGGLAPDLWRLLGRLPGDDAAPEAQAAIAIAIAVLPVATSILLRWRRRGDGRLSAIRMPTAGVVPLCAAGVLLSPAAHGSELAAGWMAWTGSGLTDDLPRAIAIAAGLGLLLSWLLARPSRLGLATVRNGGQRQWLAFARAALVSTAYLVLALLVGGLVTAWAPLDPLPLVGLTLATAAAMDLFAEWRARWRRDDLVPVWSLHHVERAEAVTSGLLHNGIDVHPRGLYLRSLLRVAGPFVPIVLLVPAARRAEAIAIVRAQLDAPEPDDE